MHLLDSVSYWLSSNEKNLLKRKIDTFISKTARLYQDTRNAGGSNMDKLNDELHDVTRIMTKNMEELLWRGDSLDRTSSLPFHVPPIDALPSRDVTFVHIAKV